MRWIVIVLLMCNGIYFIWQSYLVPSEPVVQVSEQALIGEMDTLMLLGEESADEPVVGDDSVVASQEVVVGQQNVEAVCWQIGPFKEEVSAKQVVARLEALEIKLELNSLVVEGKPDYWVHIPPQVTRRAAIKLLRELQAKRVDSFLITEGDLENGISLGFFTQEERAKRVLEQRLQQGYQAEIRHVPRSHTELWATLDAVESQKFSDALWGKIQEGNQGLERHKNYCHKIASAKNID